MEEFQALWSKVAESLEESKGKGGSKDEGGQSQGGGEEQEPATVKAAEAISENVFDHHLTKDEKEVAGPAVHYAMGAGSAAIYGVFSEFMPGVTAGADIPFGAAVWLLADEAAVPALGLSKGPTEYPLLTHAYSLASHFVYGLTTEFVRRGVRGLL
jgi:putative membrane protein